ncbi:helix-turn-helix transcriptional regulator [Streptomyces silvensis]|uniref:helix-turn-helix transcriptional regulator n=1 Tax=Streptomyces silvensis TaxID=1765722 RepID=UPI000ABBEE69|nr:AraC family transcriptional regulator [Streptomyces silvensis]
MTRIHRLPGAAGAVGAAVSAGAADTAAAAALDAAYAAYYASIAQPDDTGDGTVRHRLHPEVGDGTIEVTSLRGGFDIVRYDVAFTGGHEIRYAFPGDHFELEHCVDGRMHISETRSGAGDLRAGSVALSPRRATEGSVAHADGERYRAVSITGTWSGLRSHLADLGVDAVPDNRPDDVAHEQYLGRAATALRPAATPLAEIFLHRRSSPGRLLFLQSRLTAALAAVVDELAAQPEPVDGRGPALADHEVAALRRVPDLLWQERHTPPTLSDIARRSSMSVRRLTTGFRALYGMSVGEYHRRRCLDRAAELLVGSDWPVGRVGHEVGYASPSNFGYAFRRDRGTSPARFRRTHS